jgi:hypothetical protein
MPTTQTVETYTFAELSEDVQEKLIGKHRSYMSEHIDLYNHMEYEAIDSVQQLRRLFGINTGRTYDYITSIDGIQDIDELCGLRLRTWLINNHYDTLYKLRETYHGSTYTTVGKKRISRIEYERNAYGMTGVCYDYGLLMPLWEFIEDPREFIRTYGYGSIDRVSARLLFGESWGIHERTIENERDYLCSREYALEYLGNDDTVYHADGREF